VLMTCLRIWLTSNSHRKPVITNGHAPRKNLLFAICHLSSH
jgi:hypothetical protein